MGHLLGSSWQIPTPAFVPHAPDAHVMNILNGVYIVHGQKKAMQGGGEPWWRTHISNFLVEFAPIFLQNPTEFSLFPHFAHVSSKLIGFQ